MTRADGKRRRQKAGRPSTGRRLLRAEEADVFLPDRVPAYITWDQYQRIQPNCGPTEPHGEERREPAVHFSPA